MRSLSFVALLVSLALPLTAQEPERHRFELGLTAGGAPALDDRGTLFQSNLGTGGVYADIVLNDRWVLSPSVTNIVWDDRGLRAGALRTDLRYLLPARGRFTPYVFGSTFAFLRREAYDGLVEPLREVGLGAGAGVRVSLPFGLSMSGELRYDRWLGSDADRLGAALRVGIPIGRR